MNQAGAFGEAYDTHFCNLRKTKYIERAMAVTSSAKQIPKSHLDPMHPPNSWLYSMLEPPFLPLPSIATPTPAASSSAMMTPMVARTMMAAAVWPLLVLVLQLATRNGTGNRT